MWRPRKKIDYKDFEIHGGFAKCLVCPSSDDKEISTRSLSNHVSTERHKLNARKVAAKRRNDLQPNTPTPEASSSLNDTSENTLEHGLYDSFAPELSDDRHHSLDVPVWTDRAGNRIYFSAGEEPLDPLTESLSRALYAAAATESFGPFDGMDEAPLQEADEGATEDNEDFEDFEDGYVSDTAFKSSDELLDAWFGPNRKPEWFPYPDKAMFLTDLLFSSPRLRFSRAQQRAILSWAKELGAKVPSLRSLHKCQETLLKETGHPTQRQESVSGHVWYLNDVAKSIAKDISNPVTRSNMNFYPEDAGQTMSEVWHGSKMLREVPDHLLTPMVKHSGRIYYINELVQRTNNRWFLPKRWFRRNSSMWALGHYVEASPDGLVVNADTSAAVPVSTFVATIEEILAANSGIYPFAASSVHFSDQMPHPLRKTAGSRPVYSIPLILFLDDVSGNKSKQWNKHFSCYMSNGALPREKLMEEFHVRFVATSPTATPLEIMQGVRASIESAFEHPIEAWDCEAKEEVLLQLFALFFAGDNPMQAELCSCAGLNANFFCRTCKVGGTQEHKRSKTGFEELFKASELRSSHETRDEVIQQLLTSLEPNVATKLTEAVRNSGIKDMVAQPVVDAIVKLGQQLRKATPEREAYTPSEVQTILTEELKKAHSRGGVINPLIEMDGVNIHQDTPTEILHTILLGVVKYFWGQTVWLLDKEKKFPLFQARLNSVVAEGLNVPKIAADYMCQYRGGLIGKHFKTISQVIAFAVYDLVPREVLDAWLLIGRLTVLLWHTEIVNVDEYLRELEKTIDDFLHVTAKCSPGILISKPKFHFLVHLPAFIRRFGPSVLYSTERYESYNAVFRAASIFSNHLAPSRDIAWAFAGLDRVKHIVTGGWWKNSRTGDWTCAGPAVLCYLNAHPEHAAFVGLSSTKKRTAGSITVKKSSDTKVFALNETLAYHKAPQLFKDFDSVKRLCRKAIDVTAQSLDNISCGQHAIVRREGGPFSPLVFGTIHEILDARIEAHDLSELPGNTYVTVQLFTLNENPHTALDMPVVVRSQEYVVLSSSDIVSSVNLQHDCSHGKCQVGDTQPIWEERESTTRTRPVIHHADDGQFVVNIGSLHNYRNIAAALPPGLRHSSFKLEDKDAVRDIAVLQVQDKKRRQAEARKKLLMEKVMGRATVPNPTATVTVSDDQVVGLLNDDNDLLNVMEDVLLGSEETCRGNDADSAALSAPMEMHNGTTSSVTDNQTQEAAPVPPVFEAVRGNNSNGKGSSLSSATKEVLKYFCREEKLHVSGNKNDLLKRLTDYYSSSGLNPPTADAMEAARQHVQANALLGKVSAVSHKRKQPTTEDHTSSNQNVSQLLEDGGSGSMNPPAVDSRKRRRTAAETGDMAEHQTTLRNFLLGNT